MRPHSSAGNAGDKNDEGSIVYLNSGDWIENLTALEFVNGEWNIFRFKESDNAEMLSDTQNEAEENDFTNNQLFDIMLQEFNLMRQ